MRTLISLTAALFLLALGWLLRGWLAPPAAPVYEVAAIRRDTVKGDSVPYAVRVPVPVPRYVEAPPDTVFMHADTAAILADYFLTRRYADTLLNDTSALIALSETVARNRLTARALTFQNRRPTYITTTVLQPEPRARVYAGAMAGRGLAAPMVQVEWRRWSFGAGYNLAGGGVVGGVGYRIR